MTHPIELGANVNSGPMSSACRELYMLALAADLKDRSRLINEMICNGSMCPYMSGAPGSGVPVNQSAILTKHVVFVAIDTASLTNPVSFDVDSTVCILSFFFLYPLGWHTLPSHASAEARLTGWPNAQTHGRD